MVTLNTRIRPDVRTALKVEAAREKITLREVVGRALSHHVNGQAVADSDSMSEPMRKALASVQAVFAELRRELLVEGLRESREQVRATKGRCEGVKPYGYSPQETTVIAQIRSMRDSGMQYKQIATALDSQAVSTRSGGPWSAAVIAKIMRREARKTASSECGH